MCGERIMKNIAIIGDIILDKYIYGDVERISPEAPVPILRITEEKYILGGAGNTANNVASLGGKATLFGIVGYDIKADKIEELAKKSNINTEGLFVDIIIPTIIKTRHIGRHQQMLRVDEETLPKEDVATKHILDTLNKNKYDAIIISDYNKGVVTPNLMKEIKEYALKHNNTPIFADIKPIHKKLFKNVFLIKPNLKEAKEMCNGINDINTIGIKLSKELNCNVLITLGEKGMALFEQNKKPVFIETSAKEVFDVSGAGDTVIATLTLTALSGAGLQEATRVANVAGGIVVGKTGTATITKEELEKS